MWGWFLEMRIVFRRFPKKKYFLFHVKKGIDYSGMDISREINCATLTEVKEVNRGKKTIDKLTNNY